MQSRGRHARKCLVPRRSLTSESERIARDLSESDWSAAQVHDLESRIVYVNDVTESTRIVDDLRRTGKPVGFDLEGLQYDSLGLAQVRADDGAIYLFRTMRNPDLLTSGGLFDLFQDPALVKIVHEGHLDFRYLVARGVRPKNIFDTAVAFAVIELQSQGKVPGMRNSSYNEVSNHYGLKTNPLKYRMKEEVWGNDDNLYDQPELRRDLKIYAAADVENLQEIRRLEVTEIDPDFAHFHTELTEMHALVDSDKFQSKEMRRRLRRGLGNSLLFRYLGDLVDKSNVYEATMKLHSDEQTPFYRTIAFSPTFRTALVRFDNRHNAKQALKSIEDDDGSFKKILGANAKPRLVVPLTPQEALDPYGIMGEPQRSAKGGKFLTDPRTCARVVEMLISTRTPVVMNFQGMFQKNEIHVTVFVGRDPPFKILLSDRMIVQGKFGDLFASESVVKVVQRLDVNVVLDSLKMAANNGFRPRNFVDLVGLFKAEKFWKHGLSFFQTSSMSGRDLCLHFGQRNGALDGYMYIYLYYLSTLPSGVLDFFKARCQIEIDIGAYERHEAARILKKEFRTRYETHNVHVTIEQGPVENVRVLERELLIWFKRQKIPVKRLHLLKSYAWVEVESKDDVLKVVERLQGEVGKLRVTSCAIDVKPHLGHSAVKLNLNALQKTILPNIENLEEKGLFHLLEKNLRSEEALDLQSILS